MSAMSDQNEKTVVLALNGQMQQKVPLWLMRQAGRYLPEYREVRAQAGGFLDLVYNPALAAEVTLQPIRRFGLDAAILFSDILVIPHALGQDVRFEEGEGPRLDPLRSRADIERLSPARLDERLSSIYETVERIAHGLSKEGFTDTALIGFSGAPWTLACYMIEGGGSRDFIKVKRWAYADPESFGALIDLLADCTAHYLLRQIHAGAEIVQLFDSWAGVIDADLFSRWVIQPTRRIVETIRADYPDIPIVGFPRGAGQLYIPYLQDTGVNAVSLDYQVPVKWASGVIQPQCAVQGNLDPVCLMAGGDAMAMACEKILSALSRGPFVFNLGHGIHKDTPPEHVAQIAEIVHGWTV